MSSYLGKDYIKSRRSSILNIFRDDLQGFFDPVVDRILCLVRQQIQDAQAEAGRQVITVRALHYALPPFILACSHFQIILLTKVSELSWLVVSGIPSISERPSGMRLSHRAKLLSLFLTTRE